MQIQVFINYSLLVKFVKKKKSLVINSVKNGY